MQKKFTSTSAGRLDKIINSHIDDLSRNYISKLIKDNHITVNNILTNKPSTNVKVGDIIQFTIPPAISQDIVPKNDHLDIVFEDKHMFVINKPPHLPVHPSYGHFDDTLVNILMYHYPKFKTFAPINGIHRPGIIHRLDQDTSGLIVIAKTVQAMQKLANDLKNKKWTKKYFALCLNNTNKTNGTITKNIIRNPRDRKKFIATSFDRGKTAITHYQSLENYTYQKNTISLMDISIETGRTHQIRVHLNSEKMPILGDKQYFTKESQKFSKTLQIDRQLLHSYYLKLIHPDNGKIIEFSTPKPLDFKQAINNLKKPI